MKYIFYILFIIFRFKLSNSHPFDESKCIEFKKIIGKIKIIQLVLTIIILN